jgi:hypothetical protein
MRLYLLFVMESRMTEKRCGLDADTQRFGFECGGGQRRDSHGPLPCSPGCDIGREKDEVIAAIEANNQAGRIDLMHMIHEKGAEIEKLKARIDSFYRLAPGTFKSATHYWEARGRHMHENDGVDANGIALDAFTYGGVLERDRWQTEVERKRVTQLAAEARAERLTAALTELLRLYDGRTGKKAHGYKAWEAKWKAAWEVARSLIEEKEK